MAAERIEKFLSDISFTSPWAFARKECDKLQIWLQKHQNEIVPSASQTKLMQLLDLHLKLGKYHYADVLNNLIQTALALPEGKLITTKNKQKCLKMLHDISEKSTSNLSIEISSNISKLFILDIDSDLMCITLMNEDSGEILEGVEIKKSLLAKVQTLFDNDVALEIRVSHNVNGLGVKTSVVIETVVRCDTKEEILEE